MQQTSRISLAPTVPFVWVHEAETKSGFLKSSACKDQAGCLKFHGLDDGDTREGGYSLALADSCRNVRLRARLQFFSESQKPGFLGEFILILSITPGT